MEKPAGVPWSCRWARLGGSVRSGRTLDSPAVFWSCKSRELSAPPLFTQEAYDAIQKIGAGGEPPPTSSPEVDAQKALDDAGFKLENGKLVPK